MLNMTMPPLDDVRVRRAVAHAIDRDSMVEFKGPDVTLPAVSPVPEGYLGYTDDLPQYEYSPERARELLAEAGFPDGVTLEAIHTTLPGMLATMEAVQSQLSESGITLDIDLVEHATFHAQIREDLSQVTHYSAARFPVADTYLTQFSHSDAAPGKPTSVTNFSHCDVADEEIEGGAYRTGSGSPAGAVGTGAAEHHGCGLRRADLPETCSSGPGRIVWISAMRSSARST